MEIVQLKTPSLFEDHEQFFVTPSLWFLKTLLSFSASQSLLLLLSFASRESPNARLNSLVSLLYCYHVLNFLSNSFLPVQTDFRDILF